MESREFEGICDYKIWNTTVGVHMSQSLKKGIHPRRANSIRTSYLAKHKVFVLKNQHYFIYSKYNSIALGPTILSSEILTGNRSWLLPCLEYILINKMWEQSKFFGLKRIEQQSINIFLNFCENGRKELENVSLFSNSKLTPTIP